MTHDGVAIVLAHHERVTVRVGDAFVKIDSEHWRIEREVAAIAAVTVPTPELLWHHRNALAVRRVPGEALGSLGSPSAASPGAWRATGRMIRALQEHPPPPWGGWDADDFAGFLDGECRWLVDSGTLPAEVVAAARSVAEPALRPYPMVFTHADLNLAHVFVVGDEVTGVIDWSDACPGDAAFDIAVLTVGHQEHLDDVIAGYGGDVDLDRVRGWWAIRRLASVRWRIEHGFDVSGDVASVHRTAAERP